MKMVSWMWKGNDKDKKKDTDKEKPKEQDELNEEELQKKGFNPEGVQVEQAKQEPIIDFSKDYQGFIDPTSQQLQQIIKSLKFFPSDTDHRHQLSYSSGGKICGNKKQVSKIRSIGKEMIKLIGKKIISGDLNLTRISFPIKAMVPKTALENSTLGCCMMPYFLKKANQFENPIEKMKYALTSIISSSYYMNLFLKPLNPVIGETLQASYPDGTQIYCQQISHHPPISYFLLVGPEKSFKYYGYYAFEANAGLNSMTLNNKGRRWFQFNDGTKIGSNFNKEIYGGVFLGTLRSEAVGVLKLEDQKNKIICQVHYGKMKKKPSDYFQGSITQQNKPASKFFGSYCGFLEFDGVRYWDGRHLQGIKINLHKNPLESDFRNRMDLKKLELGKIEQAQIQKQKIQQCQRHDAKLRQQFKNK